MGSIGAKMISNTLKTAYINARASDDTAILQSIKQILLARGTTPQKEFKMEVDNLEVGDVAYVQERSIRTVNYKPVTVIKVTAKQLTTSDGQRFLRDTGDLYGQASKTKGTFVSLKTDYEKRLSDARKK